MRKSIVKISLAAIVVLGTAFCLLQAHAQRNQPPRAAFEACSSKRIQDSCSMRTSHGIIQGTCQQKPPGIVCVPWQEAKRQSQARGKNQPQERIQPGANPPRVNINKTANASNPEKAYSKVVDTMQKKCFSSVNTMECPKKGSLYYGQDSQYVSKLPAYRDNKDGTITDLNTGLMWQKTPSFNNTMNWYEAAEYAKNATIAGYTDWRLPSIKEQLSIATFDGSMKTKKPYLDTRYFDFQYPAPSTCLRDIDAQYVSSTIYRSTVMNHQQCFFGFNYADGHIKCYPLRRMNNPKEDFYVRLVRGPKTLDQNQFVDNGDGTITDLTYGLMWQKADDGKTRNWQEALAYAENLNLAGHDDWRLPNVKELQSIVDYTRINPSINPTFTVSNPNGWYWSSTSYEDAPRLGLYVAFGKAVDYKGLDTHGAGAVRGDIKSGNPAQYPKGMGPQADQIRVYNYVRCVRSIK